MRVELVAWSSAVAGLTTFIVVKLLSWMPMPVRLMLWLMGVSLMGFAMVNLVAVYDSKMTSQATVVASWMTMATVVAVPILVIYVLFRSGSGSVKVLAIASLLASACGTRTEDATTIACLSMGMLAAAMAWIMGECLFRSVIMEPSHANEEDRITAG